MVDLFEAEKAYSQFLGEAQSQPASDILPYRMDARLAIYNVNMGIQVVVAHKDEIPDHLPKENVSELLSLPRLALGTLFSALQVEQLLQPNKGLRKSLAEAQSIRMRLLKIAQGLAASELIPQAEVDSIVAGRGSRDMAEDCINLAKLFRKYEKEIAGKHSVDDAALEKAGTLGSYLVQAMQKKDAFVEKSVDPVLEVDIRARFATLLVKRYERLQAVAHYFHPTDWEKRTPALMSRRVKREPKRLTPEKKDDPQ